MVRNDYIDPFRKKKNEKKTKRIKKEQNKNKIKKNKNQIKEKQKQNKTKTKNIINNYPFGEIQITSHEIHEEKSNAHHRLQVHWP